MIMKTWNDYKEHVRTVDPEIGKDIDEVENTYRLKSRRISAKRFSLSESHRIMPNGSWAIPPVGNLTLP